MCAQRYLYMTGIAGGCHQHTLNILSCDFFYPFTCRNVLAGFLAFSSPYENVIWLQRFHVFNQGAQHTSQSWGTYSLYICLQVTWQPQISTVQVANIKQERSEAPWLQYILMLVWQRKAWKRNKRGWGSIITCKWRQKMWEKGMWGQLKRL